MLLRLACAAALLLAACDPVAPDPPPPPDDPPTATMRAMTFERILGPNGRVLDVTIGPGGHGVMALSVSASTSELWRLDGAAWTRIATLDGTTPGAVCPSPDGTRMLVATGSPRVAVFAADGTPLSGFGTVLLTGVAPAPREPARQCRWVAGTSGFTHAYLSLADDDGVDGGLLFQALRDEVGRWTVLDPDLLRSDAQTVWRDTFATFALDAETGRRPFDVLAGVTYGRSRAPGGVAPGTAGGRPYDTPWAFEPLETRAAPYGVPRVFAREPGGSGAADLYADPRRPDAWFVLLDGPSGTVGRAALVASGLGDDPEVGALAIGPDGHLLVGARTGLYRSTERVRTGG